MPICSGKCKSKARLEGKTVVITGCNTGIGKETVRDMYKRGGHVVMACRDTAKAEAAMEDIKTASATENNLGTICVVKLDLNSLESVRKCAQEILEKEARIDILINNAGVMMCPLGKTEDGFETQIGTNHLAHFLFTLLLLPRIIRSKPARIVNVSSLMHEYGSMDFDDLFFEKRSYNSTTSYSQSKLANVLFSAELARKLKANNIEGVNVYALHPGAVSTDLMRHLDSAVQVVSAPFKMMFFKSPESGAQTSIYCAVDEKCADETGLYYSDCVPKRASRKARDPESAEKLWDMSLKFVKLGNEFNPFQEENKAV